MEEDKQGIVDTLETFFESEISEAEVNLEATLEISKLDFKNIHERYEKYGESYRKYARNIVICDSLLGLMDVLEYFPSEKYFELRDRFGRFLGSNCNTLDLPNRENYGKEKSKRV